MSAFWLQVQDKMLLDCYRTALSKYTTWMQFASNQLVTMKTLLEEMGGWTEANRYKVYLLLFYFRTSMYSIPSCHKISNEKSILKFICFPLFPIYFSYRGIQPEMVTDG
jgi:hypothetical protein